MADLLIVKQNQLDDLGSQRQAMQMRAEAEACCSQETITRTLTLTLTRIGGASLPRDDRGLAAPARGGDRGP